MNFGRSSLALVLVALLAGCGAEQKPAPVTPPAGTAAPAPSATAPAAADVKPIGEAKVGDRTRCPVSGEEFVVNADSPKHEHNGKTYYFCCGGCDKKFASDPDKFLKKSGT